MENEFKGQVCQCATCKLSRRFHPYMDEMKINQPELYDAIDDLWGMLFNQGDELGVLNAKLAGTWPNFTHEDQLKLITKPND